MASELGSFVRQRRLELGMPQRRLAEVLGVSRALLTSWETGKQQFPLARLQPLAAALEVPHDQVCLLATGLHEMRPSRVRAPFRAIEHIGCTLEEVRQSSHAARVVYDAAARRLGPGPLADVRQRLLRRSCADAQLALALLSGQGTLVCASPLEEGCTALIAAEAAHAYVGHQRQLAVRVAPRTHERLTLFPQVNLVGSEGIQRVDFLVVHALPRHAPCWLALHLDAGEVPGSRSAGWSPSALPMPLLRLNPLRGATPELAADLCKRLLRLMAYLRACDAQGGSLAPALHAGSPTAAA